MRRLPFARTATVAAAVVICTLAVAAPASAHVTVNPDTATRGGWTKVSFRVPNEKASADPPRVEVDLPTATPIASVSLMPVPGWSATTEKAKLATPVKTDDGELTEAITRITWTATPAAVIKPGQVQEFDVSLGPLPDADQVVFKALQTYSDGEVVRWIDESAPGVEAEHPAPVLKLAAETDTAAAAQPVAAASSEDSAAGGDGTRYGIAGILLGLAGLVAGLLAYRRAGSSH